MTNQPATVRLKTPAALPKPPVKLNASGQRYWDTVVAQYDLDDCDLELLTAACQCLDQAEHHRRKVEREGSTYKDFRGQPKPHPSCSEHRAWLDAFRKTTRELALTSEPPDSRPPTAPRGYR